jgi:hypothetical protein
MQLILQVGAYHVLQLSRKDIDRIANPFGKTSFLIPATLLTSFTKRSDQRRCGWSHTVSAPNFESSGARLGESESPR